MLKSEGESAMEDSDFQETTLFMPDTTCASCYAEFLDVEDLNLHVKQMHSPGFRPRNCQFCAEVYTDMLEYAVHVRDTHLMDLRSCRCCTKVFLNGALFINHEKKHVVKDNLYSCSQCNVLFHRTMVLEIHERKSHDNEKDGCFLKCMPYLSSILNLNAVVCLQNVGKKTFMCSCGFESPNLKAYIRHLKVKKCSGYVCDRCSGVFKTKQSIRKHIKYAKRCNNVMDYTEAETVECKDCNVKMHAKSMIGHKQICNTMRCVDCDIICTTIDELSEHQMKEHPLDMNLIRCQFCLKEFIGQTPLKKHITRVHKPTFHLYKYKCVDCNLIFQHPQKLFAHYFMKHKDLMPFNCKICNLKFRIRKAFSLHIKLDHKSVGFVEFDEQYHVFFTASKSAKPFTPECVVPKDMFESDSVDAATKSKPYSIRAQGLLDTDADATDAESEEEKQPVKRKQIPKQFKSKQIKKKFNSKPVVIYSSDEEPLLEMRKRVLKKRARFRRQWSWKKNLIPKTLFICDVCNTNCYTYQNHRNHMILHDKDQEIECVKCSNTFKSKEDLTMHINKEHSTSKLTETLKNLLQKKKQDDIPRNEHTLSKKPKRFTISMRKVQMDKSEIPATITAVEEGVSVKNFLENFTPDVSESPEGIKIGCVVSVTRSLNSNCKKPTIKLTKFRDEPISENVSLKMPQRFKQHEHYVKTKVTVKLVEPPIIESLMPNYTDHDYSESFHDDKDNEIPEVAHEVSLEGTEEPPTQGPTKIIIPKMPKGYSKIQIATLHNEAPFFKIIKVDANSLSEIKEQEETPRREVIDLPGGTKLVTANPLAHLLGNTQLNKILEPLKSKHYKPVIKDLQGMLAQAMNKLQEPPKRKKRKPSAVKQTKTSKTM